MLAKRPQTIQLMNHVREACKRWKANVASRSSPPFLSGCHARQSSKNTRFLWLLGVLDRKCRSTLSTFCSRMASEAGEFISNLRSSMVGNSARARVGPGLTGLLGQLRGGCSSNDSTSGSDGLRLLCADVVSADFGRLSAAAAPGPSVRASVRAREGRRPPAGLLIERWVGGCSSDDSRSGSDGLRKNQLLFADGDFVAPGGSLLFSAADPREAFMRAFARSRSGPRSPGLLRARRRGGASSDDSTPGSERNNDLHFSDRTFDIFGDSVPSSSADLRPPGLLRARRMGGCSSDASTPGSDELKENQLHLADGDVG
mmetsp:Transcript_84625/g.154372  ORF Transcript_84625/g.154372 Transcript_84625/m.154372 type:complete len:315 (+) Transcript_84625:27-971(+)